MNSYTKKLLFSAARYHAELAADYRSLAKSHDPKWKDEADKHAEWAKTIRAIVRSGVIK